VRLSGDSIDLMVLQALDDAVRFEVDASMALPGVHAVGDGDAISINRCAARARGWMLVGPHLTAVNVSRHLLERRWGGAEQLADTYSVSICCRHCRRRHIETRRTPLKSSPRPQRWGLLYRPRRTEVRRDEVVGQLR
jgi:hypothetical protein